MILQSLYRYYEIMSNDPDVEIAMPGYSATGISYALNLSVDGDLLDIFPLVSQVPKGNKIVEIDSQSMLVPEKVIRSSGIASNYLWDNATYVLGLSDKEGKDLSYSLDRFKNFRERNIALLSKADCDAARAVILFLQKHDPVTASLHPVIAPYLKDLSKGGNLVFMFKGSYVHDIPEIKNVWEEVESGEQAVIMQCLVSGEKEPIARVHPKIGGVRDARATGATLVGFNARAYESFNRGQAQGLNAPVSQRVASGVGVALNYLLSRQNPNGKIYIGDATVIYWAESSKKTYGSVFAQLLNPDYAESTEEELSIDSVDNEDLASVAKKVQVGRLADIDAVIKGLDPQTRFHVLGISPNGPRLAVRFYIQDAFISFVEAIRQHYTDLAIIKEFENQTSYISPYWILSECVSPKVSKREDEIKARAALLAGALTRSILTGCPYPASLYNSILTRVRIDNDDEDKKSKKINYVRAAVIKACLLRKYRRQSQQPYQEVLQMSLNEEFSHPAYVLGRLFAVLEKAQGEAIGNANATIKDRFFSSACTTPAMVFPVLLKLSQHHTAKAKYGYALDNRVQNLLNLLPAGKEAFPARLSLDEQGIFILGYYHQRAALYSKSTEKTENIIADDAQTDTFLN